MHSNPPFRQRVLDGFHRHDPLQAECPTVYDGVVNDLLRYWSHRDTEQELQNMFMVFCNYTAKDLQAAG